MRFLDHTGRQSQPNSGREIYKEVPKHGESWIPRESHAQMCGVQAEELQHREEQEEHHGKAGNEQVLPLLPQAHQAHRNQIRLSKGRRTNG